MKKTLTVNLDGRPFMIDEDAYDILADYLRQIQLRRTPAETIADIERRLADRFSETGAQIIDLQAVRDATAYIGSPDQFGDPASSQEKAAPSQPKRLYRSRKNRVIGGVCGGMGEYFGLDSVAIRLVFLILLFFGGGLILYLIFWIVIPERPIAFMNGTEKTGK